MTGIQFLNALKKEQDLKPAYLFYGEEEFMISLAIERMKSRFVENIVLNYAEIDGESCNLTDVIEDSKTFPIMSEKRMTVIKDLQGALAKNKGEEETLLLALKDIPEWTVLVFWNKGPLDKRKKVVKFLLENTEAVEFPYLTVKERKQWIKSYFERKGKFIGPYELEFLTEYTKNGLFGVKAELDKIILYLDDKTTVTKEDIKAVGIRTLQEDAFTFLELLGKKKLPEAFLMIDDFMVSGVEVIQLLGLIAWQFRMVLLVKPLEKSRTNKEIGSILKISPYTVDKAKRIGRAYSEEEAKNALRLCLLMDHKIKTGKIKNRLALELLTAQLIAGKQEESNE